MSTKVFFTVLSVVLLSIFIVVAVAHAGVEPVLAVDNLVTAVNAGELDEAFTLFSADAVASNAVANRFYDGADEIGRFLDDWHHEGRTYDIVQANMNGDTVNITVDVADDGEVWAQQKLRAEVKDGMIQSLEVVETQLTLWRINW